MSVQIPAYPLAQVLLIKKRRVEDAQKVVQEKKKALEVEQEKLKQQEDARDKVKEHYKAKLNQLRKELDEGTTSAKIDQIKVYLKIVQENLAIEEKKVREQQQRVDLAEKNLLLAQSQLKDREREQEKIETHRTEWSKEAKKEAAIEESRAEDDLGSLMFLSRMVRTKVQ